LATIVVVLLVIIGVAVYLAATRPCRSGKHRHRHLRRQDPGMP
jgi:hypothetical protein